MKDFLEWIWPPKWPVSDETRLKMSKSKLWMKYNTKQKKYKAKWERNFEAQIKEMFWRPWYSSDWTNSLKNAIRKRDHYVCRLCWIGESNDRMHPIHHIDSDKTNNSPNNLITLCSHCHWKVHWWKENRKKWSKILIELI